MEEIAKETCACLEQISDTLDAQRATLELGVCMITAAQPYKSKIKKDYNIDMDNLDGQGEELGELVGIKMSTICPGPLIEFANSTQEVIEPEEESESEVMMGTITKVEDEDFVIFSVKDESGKNKKYYWLTFVESDLNLIEDYAALVGKSVKLTFDPLEFFDPKIKEYRLFNIIVSLELMD